VVYAVGYESATAYSYLVATYWKNGLSHKLTNGLNTGFAQSIAVNGNDVFIAGYEFSAAGTYPKLWKNGILSDEIESSKITKVQSVAVFGTDVFIAGYSWNSTGSYNQASYCKNGVPVLLENTGFTTSVANSIFVTE
jgi:hypothetical protein